MKIVGSIKNLKNRDKNCKVVRRKKKQERRWKEKCFSYYKQSKS